MEDNLTSRREYLIATAVASATSLAGCSSDGLDDATDVPDGNESTDDGTAADTTDASTSEDTVAEEETDESNGSESETEEGTVTVSGRIVDSSGSAVTSGQVIALGGPEDLVDTAPDSDGSFALDLSADSQYSFQYTQGPDGLPDLFTVGRLTPESDTDLGVIELPRAYEVAITVESENGDDVTADARISISHSNDGATTGFGLLDNPSELSGDVSITAEHDGNETTENLTVTGPRSVTLRLGAGDGDEESIRMTGRLVDSSGSAITAGQAITLGDPEGLVSVAPNDDGRFEIDLTAGNQYSLQYTQGSDGYPADGLPDLYTIGQFTPDSDIDLGTVELPVAHDVDVTVETGEGEDVTDAADLTVLHENNGATTGFRLTHDPAELTGAVTFRAEYDGEEVTEEYTIDGSKSVTLTVSGGSGTGGSATVSGRLINPSGSGVTSGQVIALGGPEDLVDTAPDSDGSFDLDLTADSQYSFQYTQGPDGLPDLFTIDRLTPETDIDLGTIELPPAYEVEITVETQNGEDVTADARVSISHTNNGATTGFGLLDNPTELSGDVSITAEYDGNRETEDLTVTEAQSVTLTVS